MRALSIVALLAPAAASARSAGELTFYWGYNRAAFSDSDIHYFGPGYDFVLHDVRAADEPEPFSPGVYFSSRFSAPQYNFRFAYFWSDVVSLSLGMDHMKYVVVPGQEVHMSGIIEPDVSGNYAGMYRHESTVVSPDLVTFEHTDGLNYISAEADRFWPLWRAGPLDLAAHAGLGAGLVVPRSDVRLFGEGLNNAFHVAGYGLSAQVGLELRLPYHVFARADAKGGWMYLHDVLTTGTAADRATQQFYFVEWFAVIGAGLDLTAAVE